VWWQKRREIGILRAMGTPAAQIPARLPGAGGGGRCHRFGAGRDAGSGDDLAVHALRARLDGQPLFAIALSPVTAMQVALIASVCGVLAAIAPARRAAAMDPAAGDPDIA